MAIKLITAQPGSYKTAMMMEIASKMASENRPIYLCNIRGLKPEIPFPYQVLDHFKDWIDTPETSVIFMMRFRNLHETYQLTVKLRIYLDG